MKQTLLYTILSFFVGNSAFAQYYEISQDVGYGQQTFYDLETQTSTSIGHDSWDIAFGANGFSSAVFVNEGTASSQASAPPEVELYASAATDFATADTTQITSRIYNDELSWSNGAFNAVAIPEDPFDLGWGTYNPANQTVIGSKVFFLVGRDGVYRKLFIESLISGTYTFRIALLDGSQEETITIDKANFTGKTLAYYSLTDGVVDLEPENWDLLFTRYTTPLDDGEGNLLEYTVTGVLHNDGVTVAELNGVDPETVEVPLVEDAYSDVLTAVGHDWKSFDLGTFSWEIPFDRVYFVKRDDNTVFRLQFVDFQGSSTGISTIYLEEEGLVSATAELPHTVQAAQLFPNPARSATQLFVDTRFITDTQGQLDIINVNGQYIAAKSKQLSLLPGENYLPIDLTGLAAGHYFVRLRLGGDVITQHLIIQ